MSEPPTKRRHIETTTTIVPLPCLEFSNIAPDVIIDEILVHYVLVFADVLDRIPLLNTSFSEGNRSHTVYPQFGKFTKSRIPHAWTMFKSITCTAKQLQSCAWGLVSTKHLSEESRRDYWKRYYWQFDLRYVFSLSKTIYWGVVSQYRYTTPSILSYLLHKNYPSINMPKKLSRVAVLSPIMHKSMVVTSDSLPMPERLPNLNSILGKYDDMSYLCLHSALVRLRNIDIVFGTSSTPGERETFLGSFFTLGYPHLEALRLYSSWLHASFDVFLDRFPKLRALELSGFEVVVITGGEWDSMKRLQVRFSAPQLLPPALEDCFVVNGVMLDCSPLPKKMMLCDSTLRFTQLVSNGGSLRLTNVSFPTVPQDEWREHPITLSGNYRYVYWSHGGHLSYSLHVSADITNNLFVDTSCGNLTLAMTGNLNQFIYEIYRMAYRPVHVFNFENCRSLTFKGSSDNPHLMVSLRNCRSVKKLSLSRIRELGFLEFDLASLTGLTFLHLRRTDYLLVGSLFDMLQTRGEPLDSLVFACSQVDAQFGKLTKRELGRTKTLSICHRSSRGGSCWVDGPIVFDVLTEVKLDSAKSLSMFNLAALSCPVLERVELRGLHAAVLEQFPHFGTLKSMSLILCKGVTFKSAIHPSTVSLINSTGIVFQSPIEKLRMFYDRRTNMDICSAFVVAKSIQRTDYSGQDQPSIKVNECTVNSRGCYKLFKTVLEERGIAVTVKRW